MASTQRSASVDQDQDLDACELEHIIGFTGAHRHTMHFHAQRPEILIYPVGCVVVLSDITDPHKQQLLRGHDEEITALVLSPSGRFLATGQKKSLYRRAEEVLVWDMESRQVVYHLHGLAGDVSSLAFTDDNRFLAASANGELIVIWDMQTGQPAQHVKCKDACSAMAWSIVPPESGRKSQLARYRLLSLHQIQVFAHLLEYDVRNMQYVISSQVVRFPSAGLTRKYLCCATSATDDQEMVCGTSAGEMMVVNMSNMVYRASLPISSNGVMSLRSVGNVVFAGSGDGLLKRLNGQDQHWSVSGEVQLAGGITSIAVDADQQWLAVATSAGRSYRVHVSTLEHQLMFEAPVKACTGVAFGQANDLCATVGDDGYLRVWDLGDYSVTVRANLGAPATAVVFLGGEVIVGLKTGVILAFEAASGSATWQIPRAHRDAVTVIRATEKLLFTAGEDGCVRAWHRGSHQFVTQFSEHTKPVTGLALDVNDPNLLHSCSVDKTLLTFDLRNERRVNFHSVQDGGFMSLSQRLDHEQELVTGGADGLVMFWDCDESQPVAAIDVGQNMKLNVVVVSPTGRFLAVGSDDAGVRVWDITTNELVAAGHGHSGSVVALAWSPDERQFITVAQDSTIAVWNFYLSDVSAR